LDDSDRIIENDDLRQLLESVPEARAREAELAAVYAVAAADHLGLCEPDLRNLRLQTPRLVLGCPYSLSLALERIARAAAAYASVADRTAPPKGPGAGVDADSAEGAAVAAVAHLIQPIGES